MPTYGVDEAFVNELKSIDKEFNQRDPIKYESFL